MWRPGRLTATRKEQDNPAPAANASHPCGRRGLTLLELAVALGVFCFGVLGVQGFLILVGRTGAEQSLAMEALACAQDKVEELRFRITTGGHPGEGADSWGRAGGARLERRWAVEAMGSVPGVLRVRVECGCLVRGREMRRSLETLVCPDA